MRAVNLIPSEQRKDSASLAGHSEGTAYGVLGLLAGIAILAVLYGIARHDISGRAGEAAQLKDAGGTGADTGQPACAIHQLRDDA